MNTNGEILLKRKNGLFKAGFCVINKNLQELVREIYVLHSDEKTYYETLQFDKRKKSYLLGRIAGKKALSNVLSKQLPLSSISIQFGVFQFPVLKYDKSAQNTQVSISHAGNYGVALAFPEEHPLGIDVEKIAEDKIEAMRSLIMGKELDLIYPYIIDLSIRCTLLWTIKESLSKILRTGLTIDFKLLEIESVEKKGLDYISVFKNFSQYKAISRPVGGCVCSIVLPKNTLCDLSSFWDVFEQSMVKK